MTWLPSFGFAEDMQTADHHRYVMLARGVLDIQQELEISDTSDAVLLFRWKSRPGHAARGNVCGKNSGGNATSRRP